MDASSTLFDLEPYSFPTPRRATSRLPAIAPEVWNALRRLKQTMDDLPPVERERRRRAWMDSERR